MRGLRCGALLLLAGSVAILTECHAIEGDTVTFTVGSTAYHDSNVFRLPEQSDPLLAIGSAERGDWNRALSVGVKLERPVSRQKLMLSLNLTDTKYQRFNDLDNTGRDARGIWSWRAGNFVNGELGFSETVSLAGFANFQARLKNLLNVRQVYGNGGYDFAPDWRVHAGMASITQANGAAARAANDNTEDSVELGLRYISPLSGNSAGLKVRRSDVSFPNRSGFGLQFFDSAYRQSAIEGSGEWRPTERSQFSATLGYQDRSYQQLRQRDFGGTSARLNYDWYPSVKTGVSVSLRREFMNTEDLATTYAYTRTLSVRPSWAISPKLALQGSLDYITRDFLGDPGFVLGASPKRIDTTRSASLSLNWRPRDNITASIGLQRDQRVSTVAGLDFLANGAYGNLQVNF